MDATNYMHSFHAQTWGSKIILSVISFLPEQEGLGDSSDQLPQINQTDYMPADLESLHLKVDQLEKHESKPKFVINTTDLPSVLNETCRSNEIILSLMPCFTTKDDRNDEGFFCTICDCILKYNFGNGLSFNSSGNLPASFSHLTEFPCTSTTKEVLYKQLREAIHCESAAYLGYKYGLSYSFYENHISGGNFGLKNHSKEFSRNSLGPMCYILDVLDA